MNLKLRELEIRGHLVELGRDIEQRPCASYIVRGHVHTFVCDTHAQAVNALYEEALNVKAIP